MSADESAMKTRNCAGSPAPSRLESAAARAPMPNQSKTNPGVKTSAMTSITPRIVHRIQTIESLIASRSQPLSMFFNTNQTFAGRSASLRMK